MYSSRREGIMTASPGYTFSHNLNHETFHSNDHIESVQRSHHGSPSSWVPPNDRELIIRAKLKTGWSSRNNSPSPASTAAPVAKPHNDASSSSSSSNCSSQITDLECLEIDQVLARAAKIEKKELSRIRTLYERWNLINKPLGNGKTNCFICNCNFGILESSPKICSDCLKNVCSTCSIDTVSLEASGSRAATIYFCKICSEYREFLKKSGAWFSKRLPSEDLLLRRQVESVLSLSTSSMSGRDGNNNQREVKLESSTSETNVNMMQATERGETEEEGLVRSMSGQDTKDYKRLPVACSDDESCVEPNSKQPNDTDIDHYFTNANSTRLPFTTNQPPTPLTSTLPVSKPPVAQSNSSLKLSEDLRTEYERQSFVVKPLFSRCDLPQNSYSKKSLVDLTNLADKYSLKSTATADHNSNDLGSAPNLNDTRKIQDQIANSRNLAKASPAVYGSMINLSTASAKSPSLGSIQFTVEYIHTLLQLKIHLVSATNLPALDSNGLSDPYVKLHLLPGIAKATKLRSKTVYKNLNPVFDEYLQYDGITLQDLDSKSLRLTVLDKDKFGYDFIGEYRLALSSLTLSQVNSFDVRLESKRELGDEYDTTFRGKINFSLKYCKSACCLYVKINRCRQLLPMDNGKSSDPFVEICILPPSSAKELKNSRFKTTVKKKTLDPEFNEEFKFVNIDLKQLLSKTIELTVWDKDFGKNDYIGSVSLNQHCTGVELKHFFTMVKNTDIYHEQWHTLQNKADINDKSHV